MSAAEIVAQTPELFPLPPQSPPAPAPMRMVRPPAAEPSAGLAPEPRLGQLILGTDKRNPVFNVYEDEAGEGLLVYYGFEIIELVPNDPEAPSFKLLLGRLYNAGLKLSALCESFGVDPKTVRRWGQALLQMDPAELVRVLAGRQASRKLKPEVQRFARARWPDLVSERRYGAVGRLQAELEKVFGLQISRSGMEDLVRELKAGVPPATGEESTPPEPEKRETTPQSVAPENSNNAPLSPPPPPLPPPTSTHPLPVPPLRPGSTWSDHAGSLIFAKALAEIARVPSIPQSLLPQWLVALLLGAQNIEQSKYLNWEDLEWILGGVVRFPSPQREALQALATDPELLQNLWRFNQALLEVGTDFYFDPHTQHYTGEQPVLKGWCPKIRFADKALHSDFIHTPAGAPIYFETTDNFADLRQRFQGVTQRARVALGWPPDRVLTFVVDRGIFGQDFFEQILDDPALHLITWEKGFVAEAWDPQKVLGKTTITRCRNSSKDLRHYQFEYWEGPWKGNPRLRQIVVQATDCRGRVIQVAILTDDPKRAASEIIQLMFLRWLQENDFKYLDKHYGINQLTSYRSIPYAELQARVTDRAVKSLARKDLERSFRKMKDALKRQLFAEEQAGKAHQVREQKRVTLETQWAAADAAAKKGLQRKLKNLEGAAQRYEQARVVRRQAIELGHTQMAEHGVKMAATQTTESRLEALIRAGMVKMDGQSKRLMDQLKITARNLFYQTFQPFKRVYDNYRDDHDHFRKLTQAPGVLEVAAEEITIHLLPRTQYGGELRKAVTQFLEELNSQRLVHPCHPEKKLKFRLGQRAELQLRMHVTL